MFFDHIKVLEQASSSSTALEFIAAAPPLSYFSYRWLPVCRLLSHCSASLSSGIPFWADVPVSIQLFVYTWPGFFPWFRLVSYQSLRWRYSYPARFSLLCLSCDTVDSGPLFVACYSSCPSRIPQLRMVFPIPFLNFGPPDRAPVSVTISGQALTWDYHVIF